MAKHTGSSGREPMALALILCDHVHIDPITGRHTALGAFHGIEAESYPVTFPKMAVYAALTDGRGHVSVTIRLIDADENDDALWTDIQEVAFDNPLDVQELSVIRFDVEFPYAGVFRLQLLADGATIIDRGIIAKLFNEGDVNDD